MRKQNMALRQVNPVAREQANMPGVSNTKEEIHVVFRRPMLGSIDIAPHSPVMKACYTMMTQRHCQGSRHVSTLPYVENDLFVLDSVWCVVVFGAAGGERAHAGGGSGGFREMHQRESSRALGKGDLLGVSSSSLLPNVCTAQSSERIVRPSNSIESISPLAFSLCP